MSYVDDFLTCINTKYDHEEIINKIIERARKNKIKLNIKKRQYYVNEVKFFGFLFNKDGSTPDQERLRVIYKLNVSTNRRKLQSFLGMINYLRSLH